MSLVDEAKKRGFSYDEHNTKKISSMKAEILRRRANLGKK